MLAKEMKVKMAEIEKQIVRYTAEAQKRIDSDGNVTVNQEISRTELLIAEEIIRMDARLEEVASGKLEVERLKTEMERETSPVKKEEMYDIIMQKTKYTLSKEAELKTITSSIKEKQSALEELQKAKETKADLIKETVEEERKCAAYTVRPSRKYCVKYEDGDEKKPCLEWKSVYRTSNCLIFKDGKCAETEYKYDSTASRYECVTKDERLKINSCEEFNMDGSCKVPRELFGVKECSEYKIVNAKIECANHSIFFPEYVCTEKFENGKCKKRHFYKPRFFC